MPNSTVSNTADRSMDRVGARGAGSATAGCAISSPATSKCAASALALHSDGLASPL
jgi:hypothetical protein